MWNKLRKWLGLKSKVEKYQDLKKSKWVEFCKANSARIAYFPVKQGRKQIPAAWDENLKEWIWVSHNRNYRRQVKKRLKI